MQGIISGLKAGEIRNLQMTVQLTEEQAGELIHTVTVKAKYPGKEESIGCQKSVENRSHCIKRLLLRWRKLRTEHRHIGDRSHIRSASGMTGERTLHSFSVQKDSKMPVFRQTLSGKRA